VRIFLNHSPHLFKFFAIQTETKESKWDMPDELLLVLEKVEKEAQAPAAA